MRAVCARAGLVDRYFYESFTDRNDLLVSSWDTREQRYLRTIVDRAAAANELSVADQLRSMIAAFVSVLVDDPDGMAIVLGDHRRSELLEERRRASLQMFTEVIVHISRPRLDPAANETALRMSTVMGIGGFYELISAWHAGTIPATSRQLVEHSGTVAALLVWYR